MITMLGWPDELTYSLDASSGNVLIDFPSMSKLEKECGDGCQWGYVLKFDGLDNADEIPEVFWPKIVAVVYVSKKHEEM